MLHSKDNGPFLEKLLNLPRTGKSQDTRNILGKRETKEREDE